MPANPSSAAWRTAAIVLIGSGLAAWLASLWLTVSAYATREAMGEAVLLWGVPIPALGVSVFVLPVVFGVAMLARQAVRDSSSQTGYLLACIMLVLGVIGWAAAFALAADKVLTQLEDNPDLSCNVSLLVQCGANLESWQGSVFGFPNPLIGLAGWAAVIAVGALHLGKVRLARWFWIAFTSGAAAALVFVIWLIGQSIFVLGTLCPWCMVTWAVTIPLFWAVSLYTVRTGHWGDRAARSLSRAYGWVPLLTVVSYIAVAIVAQARLDVLSYLPF